MKRVAILLATYCPQLDFFKQQLMSINQQDYPNCHLYVRDDSGSEEWFEQIRQMVEQCITIMPVTVLANQINQGSNRTFEQLTLEASGDYFAYCDQDDVWYAHKITRLVQEIEADKASLCYSDLSVINEKNELLYASFTQYNKRVNHVYGQDTFGYFIRRNSVTGCTMLIKKEVAHVAVPFHEHYVHDHWLALVAAKVGRIAYVAEPLIQYRIHAHNQIGKAVLKEIETVDDYMAKKLLSEREKFLSLTQRLDLVDNLAELVQEELRFVEVRIRAFETRKWANIWHLWTWRSKDTVLVCLEVLLTLLPKSFGNYLLKRIKK